MCEKSSEQFLMPRLSPELLLPLLCLARAQLAPLSAETLRSMAQSSVTSSHSQPSWDRRDGMESSPLQRAAVLHQEGSLDKAVQQLKALIKDDTANAEAYTLLAKCLNDQNKHSLADKAMIKANRIRNEALSQWGLF